MKSITSRSQELGVGKGDSKIAKNSYLVNISWIVRSVPLNVWTWNSTLWWMLSSYTFDSCFEKIELNRVGQLYQNHEKSGKSGKGNSVILKVNIWSSKKVTKNRIPYSANLICFRQKNLGKNYWFWALLHGEKRPQSFLVFFLFIYGAKLDWI